MRQRYSIFNRSAGQSSTASPGLFFQPRLATNQPNDIYEQEADTMADAVMNMDSLSSKRPFFSSPSIPTVQRQGDPKASTTTDEKKPEEKKEAEIGFIDTASLKKAIKDIFGKLPDRYK